MKVVLDIETDELNASVVNCIVAKNIDTLFPYDIDEACAPTLVVLLRRW